MNEQMNEIVVQRMHCIMIYAECVNFPGISLFGPFSVHVAKCILSNNTKENSFYD